MKNKKLIGTMALFLSITGSMGGIANAASTDSSITAPPASVNTINTVSGGIPTVLKKIASQNPCEAIF